MSAYALRCRRVVTGARSEPAHGTHVTTVEADVHDVLAALGLRS